MTDIVIKITVPWGCVVNALVGAFYGRCIAYWARIGNEETRAYDAEDSPEGERPEAMRAVVVAGRTGRRHVGGVPLRRQRMDRARGTSAIS